MAAEPLKVIVFLGSTREGRNCERVSKYVIQKLKDTNHHVDLFDPMEMPFPLLQQPLHFMKDQSQAPQWLKDADAKIRAADAYVLIMAEYNCGVPPALSNMLDHFSPSAYSQRPAAIVSYSAGNLGGSRAICMALPMLNELTMVTIPIQSIIPKVYEVFTEDGKTENERVIEKINKLVTSLDWFANALRRQRLEDS